MVKMSDAASKCKRFNTCLPLQTQRFPHLPARITVRLYSDTRAGVSNGA